MSTDEEAEEEEEWSSGEEERQRGPGTVYRLVKGQLKKLEGGMEQYEEIAGRAAAKLGGSSSNSNKMGW